jgi:hypothetical protein
VNVCFLRSGFSGSGAGGPTSVCVPTTACSKYRYISLSQRTFNNIHAAGITEHVLNGGRKRLWTFCLSHCCEQWRRSNSDKCLCRILSTKQFQPAASFKRALGISCLTFGLGGVGFWFHVGVLIFVPASARKLLQIIESRPERRTKQFIGILGF